MLRRVLSSRSSLTLAFERGECVLVPQTAHHSGLHADVRLTVAARRPAVIEDACLLWSDGGRVLRRSRWDRAVIDGRFRYPPAPLDARVQATASVTLTFTDPLIPHQGAAPPLSRLSLELSVPGRRKPLQIALWRLSMRSWDEAANVVWMGPRGA